MRLIITAAAGLAISMFSGFLDRSSHAIAQSYDDDPFYDRSYGRQDWDRRHDRARERAERRREQYVRREEQRRNRQLDRRNRQLDQRNRELDRLNRELDERNREIARRQRERSNAIDDW